MKKHVAAVHQNPTPAPTPSLPVANCVIQVPQGASVMTVGEKRELQCEAGGTGVTSQSKIEFSNLDKDHQYAIQFLGPARVAGDKIIQIFTSYRVGKNDLRVMMKVDGREFQLSPLALDVTSVIKEDQQQQQPPGQTGQEAGPTPYPLVDPSKVPAPWWWWALWGLVLLLLIAFAARQFILWRREKKRAEQEAVIRNMTPREKFQMRLRKLESQGFHMRGEYKSFALELTNILKTSIGAQYGFPAEDMTTEELLETLEKRYRVFFRQAGMVLKAVLAELDQIKFAKIETNSQRCQALLDDTHKIGNALFGGNP